MTRDTVFHTSIVTSAAFVLLFWPHQVADDMQLPPSRRRGALSEHVRPDLASSPLRPQQARPASHPQGRFAAMQQHTPSPQRQRLAAPPASARVFYNVPAHDNTAAMRLGARFDGSNRKWCAPTSARGASATFGDCSHPCMPAHVCADPSHNLHASSLPSSPRRRAARLPILTWSQRRRRTRAGMPSPVTKAPSWPWTPPGPVPDPRTSAASSGRSSALDTAPRHATTWACTLVTGCHLPNL